MGTGVSFQFSPDKSGCALSKAAQGLTPRRTLTYVAVPPRREENAAQREKGHFWMETG